MPFQVGDRVRPTGTWDRPWRFGAGQQPAAPSGVVKEVIPFGAKGQLVVVGDYPRPLLSGIFEKVEPAA